MWSISKWKQYTFTLDTDATNDSGTYRKHFTLVLCSDGPIQIPMNLEFVKDLWLPNIFIYNLKTFKVCMICESAAPSLGNLVFT